MTRKSTSEKRKKCSPKDRREDDQRKEQPEDTESAGLSPEEKIELIDKAHEKFQEKWGLWIM